MIPSNGVPPGYHTFQPYLMLRDAQAAIAFYRQAFGATERLCIRAPDGRVAHAEIAIGDSCLMMADENPAIGAWGPEHFGGSSVGLVLYVPDCDATYRQALAAGATSKREPADQPHGARMGSVTDPFGYSWHLGTHQRDMSREELEALTATS